MKNKILNIAVILIMLMLITFIFILFLSNHQNADYRYTFEINSVLNGNETELMVIEPSNDYIGNTVLINEDNIQFDNNEYMYFTKKKGNTYDFVVLKYDGEYHVVTGVSVSSVEYRSDFENSMIGSGYGGSSVSVEDGFSEDNSDEDIMNLLSSALTVYLAVSVLYSRLKIYFVVYGIVLILCCLCYFKPDIINKVFNKENYGVGNKGKVRGISCIIMLIGALAMFLL